MNSPTMIAAVLAACVGAAAPAAAQIAVSANDAKMTVVDGVNTPILKPPPDSVSVIDFAGGTPRIIGEVKVPTSIIGPPQSVAIAPDESIALIAASTKIDPADPTKTVYDNVLSVIDLRASPPAVIATLQAGIGASGVSINRAGTLAIVTNRYEGSLSVFSIAGKTVTPVGKVSLDAPESQPSGVAFSRDGRIALVTRNNDHLVSILDIDGTSVKYAKRDIAVSLRPYGIEVTAAGDAAVVAGTGLGATGGADLVSVIDLTMTPPRTVDHAAVGITAEGVSISPDGRFVAVSLLNGSNNAKSSPFFASNGILKILSLTNRRLSVVAEAPTGRWCQGIAWSADGRTLLLQAALEGEIQVFSFDGKQLKRGAALKVVGGPSGIRTAQK